MGKKNKILEGEAIINQNDNAKSQEAAAGTVDRTEWFGAAVNVGENINLDGIADNDLTVTTVEPIINNGPTAEEIAAKETEAKAHDDEQAKIDAEAEAKRLAESEALEAAKRAEAELDMSLDARFQRAKEALEDAIDAQNQINRLVNQRTKELDALILEKEAVNPTNSISEIQFYLTGSKRKREESASRRRRMLESVLDPAEIIRQLDPRSPIDRRPPVRKAPHGSVQHPGTKPQKTA